MTKIRWTPDERLLVAKKLATINFVKGSNHSKLAALQSAQQVLMAHRQRPFVLSNAANVVAELIDLLPPAPKQPVYVAPVPTPVPVPVPVPAPTPAPTPTPKSSEPISEPQVLQDIGTVLNSGLFSTSNLVGLIGTASLIGLAFCALKQMPRKDLVAAINSVSESLQKS